MTAVARVSAAEVRPGVFVGYGTKPSCVTPEPGWWAQCRHEVCPGFWRTGLDAQGTAVDVAVNHYERFHW